MMRGRPIGVRLAVILAAVVVVVLLLAGIVVNRAVSRSFDETLAPREAERMRLATVVVEESLERGADDRLISRILGRVADQSGGVARLRAPDGSLRAEAGQRPTATREWETLTEELSAAAGGGTLEVVVPSAAAPFLRTFNTALVIVGVVSVVALLGAAAVVSNRLTRPLRAVADAAHRLGGGDLGARAPVGPDAESAELATAFNGMADRLEQSETLRRRAASDLAHDLATPATVLESQLQAMLDGVVPADRDQLEKARIAAAGLSGVILQLGELTQAEAAPLQRAPETVGLVTLAREIVAAMDGLLRERRVSAEVDGADAGVRVDRGQLMRAMRNVITNAVQHAPAGTAVRVEIEARGAEAVVRVHDEGPGIADEDLPYVFERFYRADRSRAAGRSGSGIGLTVARELIAANGGTIDVESTGPSGTTIRITLAAGSG